MYFGIFFKKNAGNNGRAMPGLSRITYESTIFSTDFSFFTSAMLLFFVALQASPRLMKTGQI